MKNPKLYKQEYVFDTLTGNKIPVNSINNQSVNDVLKGKLLEISYSGQTKLEDILQNLVESARGGEDSLSATKEILDRLLGKPKQSVETVNVNASLEEFLHNLNPNKPQNTNNKQQDFDCFENEEEDLNDRLF